ncbi:MAG: hypothetical protein HYX34_02255 [Actinobacteria bacterium]|nr:hypothetical protein [Actinomycetota bacterium]
MTTEPNDQTVAADEASAHASADAGPVPTPEQEQAAERAAKDVDVESVGAHEAEMTEIGANVEGEGQVG